VDPRNSELLTSANNYLINLFKDIRLVHIGMMDGLKLFDIFLNLPFGFIKKWVKFSSLIIDSENSVFDLLMKWFLKEDKKSERIPLFPRIIKHIRFSNMRSHYLKYIVPNTCKYLGEDTAEELKLLIGSSIDLSPQPQRMPIPEGHKAMFKCVFREVDKWTSSGKYYSSPVPINGYDFFCFLQCQVIRTSENQPRNGLGGYLRCSGSLIPSRHALPIAYSMTIQTSRPEFRERRFSTMRVVFESPDKAIGGKLTIGNESWEEVISGESPIVAQNTITLIISIEFLTSDEGCLVMRESTG